MKIGFLADLHLNVVDPLSHIDAKTGFSIRTLDRFKALQKAIEISIQEGCDYFILGGDIYDKLNPSERLKTAFLHTILPYSDKIKIILFPGNHDGADFTHNYLSEEALLSYIGNPPFKIISEIATLYTEGGTEKFMFIPWTTDLNLIIEKIKEVEPGLVCFGHLEIQGALASTEYVLTSGLHPALFDKFKKVLLGHYHKRQRVSQKVSYVGSPIIKDFSELEVEKGFIIYNTNNNSESFYQLEERKVFNFRISNDTLDEIDKYLEKNPIPEGSLIKLEFIGTSEWYNEMAKSIYSYFMEFKPLKIKRTRITIKEEIKEFDSVLKIQSRIERIKEYSKDMNNENLTNLGIKLYQEAENSFIEVKV